MKCEVCGEGFAIGAMVATALEAFPGSTVEHDARTCAQLSAEKRVAAEQALDRMRSLAFEALQNLRLRDAYPETAHRAAIYILETALETEPKS